MEHVCSFDEMQIQHDPACPACRAENAGPQLLEVLKGLLEFADHGTPIHPGAEIVAEARRIVATVEEG